MICFSYRMPLLIIQRAILSFFIELFYFPLWWYTGGAVFMFQTGRRLITAGAEILSPGLWWRYLFVPMYGQYNWQGRIMSFLVRLVQGVVRGAIFLVWMGVVGVLILAWFMVPFLVARGIMIGFFHS